RATSQSYPPRPVCQINTPTRSRICRAVTRTAEEVRPPILVANDQASQLRVSGSCSPLEGGEAFGLSASLWGEQVITYAGSGDRANRGCSPGVSSFAHPLPDMQN